MNKKTILSTNGLSSLFVIILLSVTYCSADNEENSGSTSRPQSSDSDTASRAISPKKEYTRAQPAEWESIADDHIPEIEFNQSKSKDNIKVKVLGRKFTERHYIEVIGIMDERSADLDVKYLQRGDNPTVILSLNTKEYDPEKIKVFAKCNLHDLWTVPLIAPIE